MENEIHFRNYTRYGGRSCKLFDYGVMIDYGSTDTSNKLIRQMAPNWEIRKSRNKVFDVIACDQESGEERWHLSPCILAVHTLSNL